MDTNLLTAKELNLLYGQNRVFTDLSFSLAFGKKIGLVGINGSGKTSLLKILAGKLENDRGEIFKANNLKIEYLEQDFVLPDVSIQTFLFPPELMDADNEFAFKIQQLWPFFNLPSMDTRISHLSGGLQRQLGLLKVLASQADILLLDEPTNHIDFLILLNLQKLLREYSGTILMISHDRYFLDQVVGEIWELHNQKLFFHTGNYSDFLSFRKSRQEVEIKKYQKLKQELNRELEWVRSGVKARGTKDQGRLNRFAELKHLYDTEKPVWQKPYLPIPKPAPFGNKILILREFETNFLPDNKKPIVKDLNLEFRPQMRLGILGPNGSGKTTLLQSILGRHKFRGKLVIGQNTQFNYQDQKRRTLDENKTIMQIISQGNIEMKFGTTKTNVFAYLKKFLFDSDDIKKTVDTLSGGQRARVLLAKILKEGGNFLILDEPTNDLDIDSMQSLENTLLEFEGCVILVSHDRFFLDQVCTDILALEGEGKFTLSTGNYSAYIKKYGQEVDFWQMDNSTDDQSKNENEDAGIEGEKVNLSPKEKRKYRLQLRQFEDEIKIKQKNIDKLVKKISNPDFYTLPKTEIESILQTKEEQVEILEQLESSWLEIAEILENS